MTKLTTKEMKETRGGVHWVICEEEDALGCTTCWEWWNDPTPNEYWCCDFEEAGGKKCVQW
jgi:hypothetical protein